MGGTHQALVAVTHRLQQQLLAPRVKLGQHIVEQQQRRLTHHLAHQVQLPQLQGQHQGALLAGGAIAPGGLAADQQRHLVPVRTHLALAQPFLLGTLLAQLFRQGLPPGSLLVAGLGQHGAADVVELERFGGPADALLPGHRQRLQAPQGPLAPAMQAGADQGHLLIEGVQQLLPLTDRQTPPQQLAALPQQPPVAAQQGAIDGFELQHHPVEPLAPKGGLPPHQVEVEGAEADAAQGADQVELPFQPLAVAERLAAATAAQLQLQAVGLVGEGAQATGGVAVADQVPVDAATVRSQAGEQFHAFQQVRLSLAIAADHEQAGRLQRQLQAVDVAEMPEVQAVQPDGSGAVSR